MKQISVNKTPFAPKDGDLPLVIHGREGSGASFFSIILAASFCHSGQPMLFWSAYPMAKEEFYKEFDGEIHKIKSAIEITDAEPPVIVIENGDANELAATLSKIDPGRILFVKNFETLPKEIRDKIVTRQRLIISGDMENILSKEDIAPFPTQIFFSAFPSVELPPLEKYQGWIKSLKKNGVTRIIMDN